MPGAPPSKRIPRRAFLKGAAVTAVGSVLAPELAGKAQANPDPGGRGEPFNRGCTAPVDRAFP